MLGKLFNLGAGPNAGAAYPAQTPSSKHISSLDSVQEDIHTRNLLFPDPQDLFEHRQTHLFPLSSGPTLAASASTNAFDYDGDVELDTRDIRVVVMQDAMSSVTSSLLYDSQPPPPIPTTSADRPSTMAGIPHFSAQDSRRVPTSPRKPSLGGQRPLGVQPDSPQFRQGAFDRRPAVPNRNQLPAESDAQRVWREYREEVATLSGCIFGSSEIMAYKGTSTKVHLVPSELRLSDSMLGDGRGSLGRSSMRSSRLSQSFSSENMPAFHAPPTPSTRVPDRKRVLITRLFPVALPADEEPVGMPQGRFSEDSGGFPFPTTSDELKTKRKKPQVKQKKTPMYAVALIINLPRGSPHSMPASSRSDFQISSSFTDQDSFPSSFSSTRPSGWSVVGNGGRASDTFEPSFVSEIEDRMDAITQHWDVVMRTMTHLQSVVASILTVMLKQADLASPDPLPPPLASLNIPVPRTSSLAGRRSEDSVVTVPVKPPKTNAKHITLLPHCLLDDKRIAAEVERARNRIVHGLRATRVVTGQNRWPMWREEARWVVKWAGGRDQGFFFFNLLTGFLATHTEWIHALSPPGQRRRHGQQTGTKSEEDATVPARTIIVANDKMAARRLVFLLSAFLPAAQQFISMPGHRPSTAASFGHFSPSPPTFVVPILKEESLRRKINRRTGAGGGGHNRRASHSRNPSVQSQIVRTSGIFGPAVPGGSDGKRERRASDAGSIKTVNLPIPGSDRAARKSSSATTATVTPETSMPHFAVSHRAEMFSKDRPGSSSNSTVADDLKRLAREDSEGVASMDSRQNSRWGNMISGLWSTRRRDSGAGASQTHSRSSSGIWNSLPGSPIKATPGANQGGSISQVVSGTQEPSSQGRGQKEGGRSGQGHKGEVTTPSQLMDDSQIASNQTDEPEPAQKPRRIPDPSGAFESPVKTSINLDDGVIDVDVPFPDYLASFETAVSSPSSSGYLSAAGYGTAFDAFEHSTRAAANGDIPPDVAGWLPGFHPDFVLQAVPPQQKSLVDEVKRAMRDEPFPSLTSQTWTDPNEERWVHVSDAIIADTTTFTIKRIRHRRLLKPKPVTATASASYPRDRSPGSSGESSYQTNPTVTTPGTTPFIPPPPLTPAIPPYETQVQDEFIEEPLVTWDEVLTEAVERVVAVGTATTTSTNTEASKQGSECSSRSNSKRRKRRNSEADDRSGSRGKQGLEEREELGVSPKTPTVNVSAASTTVSTTATAGAGPEVPRSQCKVVILSALEEIVRDVAEEVEHGGEEAPEDDEEDVAQVREKESVLRQAVRRVLAA